MTKQSAVLISLAVLLLGARIVFFTDWFVKPRINILPQIRPPLRGVRVNPASGDVPVFPVSFQFDQPYQFTEIRVVAAADEKTNKYPHAVWHMISDSNSVASKLLQYGAPMRGMKPKIPRGQPEPLEPDVVYRLYVNAGRARGVTNFQTHEFVKPAAAAQ